jgi:N-methylhydantoinase A/oxoprolinase/acetone carboxylase beta subunit
MKLKFIGCGVFKPEITALVEQVGNDVDCVFLPQGLHATPDTLRRELQAGIDATSPSDGYHAIVVGFGLCGRGAAGIVARNVPVIIPRIHDCIAAFLGSHRRYAEEFGRHPGTYWFTPGFITSGGQPGVRGKYHGIFARNEKLYEEYLERYGEETARYLVEEWSQGWVKNYTRAAFIPWDYPEVDQDRELTRTCAANLGWRFDELEADHSLLRDLLAGRWDPERFLEVLPGSRVVPVGDARIMDALTPEESALLESHDVRDEIHHYLGDHSGAHQVETPPETNRATNASVPGGLSGSGIGIDAGGTFTDVVLFDFDSSRVIASAKSPSTPAEPAKGVANALAQLPQERLPQVKLVTLATTFATNAIVENRGGAVGLLLLGYDEWSFARVPHRPAAIVPGAHNIDGSVRESMDEAAVRRAVDRFVEHDNVQAIAIVEYGGCRNPEFEIQAKSIVQAVFDGPVQCAHELTSELDCLRRATTVAVNARIAPLIVDLVRDVQSVLRDFSITAPLSVVRADGSVIAGEEACNRPVEMVLSGPAASICGAHALTGIDGAVVIDVGGTTSDVARLEGGRPLHNGRGAVIGEHRTTVRAPSLLTTGLGGDSRIRINRKGQVEVGPRRVLPLCVLAESEPSVSETLTELRRTDLAELSLLPAVELYCLQRQPSAHEQLSDREYQIVEILKNGPGNILDLSRGLEYPYLSCIDTSRLEQLGIVIRSGFTPTDLLHVEGQLDRWNADISNLALEQLAFRAGVTAGDLASQIRKAIERLLVRMVVAVGMGLDGPESVEDDPLAARFFASAASGESDGIVTCSYKLSVPVVGIGAPAHSFVPDAARAVGTQAIVPDRAGVAGAVGAITGSVMEAVSVLIRPDTAGFTMHAPDHVKSFTLLESARSYAREHAVELVRQRALRAGAERFHIRVHMEDRKACSADGGIMYIDTQVRAEAASAPRVR